MNKNYLPYNPGDIPCKPPCKKGDSIEIKVDGLPPIKAKSISCRNPKNPRYQRYVELREKASKAMNGRAWYFGAIEMNVEIYHYSNDALEVHISDYVGGIMDTLDGSSGVYFTYLPIVYEDDCQISSCSFCFKQSEDVYYKVLINFK